MNENDSLSTTAPFELLHDQIVFGLKSYFDSESLEKNDLVRANVEWSSYSVTET
jgi:hypothetical protein